MKEKIKKYIFSLFFCTWVEKLVKFFLDFIAKYPEMGIGALLGGINLVTFADSFCQNLFNIPLPMPWVLPPFIIDHIRQIFSFFREFWSPLTEFIARFFSFELPSTIKDYITMGIITAGMRFRSSFTIWKGVNNGFLKPYEQKTILPNNPIFLHAGECCKFWFLFLPIRVSYAFIAWPSKIGGAIYRFNKRYLKSSSTGERDFTGEAEKVRIDQYMAFFSTFIVAVLILLSIYILAIGYWVFNLVSYFW